MHNLRGKPIALTLFTAFPLNATPVGSTNDNTLRWDTNVQSGAFDALRVLDTAADGTSFECLKPGFFIVEFMLVMLASVSLLTGVSLGGTNLNANPVMNAGGMIATNGPFTLPAATTLGVYTSVTAHVTSGLLNTGGNGRTLRTHATDNANGTPAASITEAGSWCRISYIACVG